MYKDKRESFLIYAAVITLVFTIIFVFFISNYYQKKDEYYAGRINELDNEINTTLHSYGLFSKYIYENYIETDYILELVDTAYEADTATQDLLRTELYDYLIDEYDHVKEYDFRQVHFHFPDSTSFLRMHFPEKYGDSLYEARYSVRTVNEDYVTIAGFEEGRVVNGYRFVYPLIRNGEHIGSVEVSVALTSVINVLTELTDSDYYFVIDKEVVYDKVYSEYLDNYQVTEFSENFLVDIGTIINCQDRNLIEERNFEDFLGSFDVDEIEKLDEFIEFGFSTKYEKKNYEVIFTPIANIEGEDVAYMISISEINGVRDLYLQNLLVGGLIFSLYIGILLLSGIFIRNRNLLQTISYSDGLTNISNRRKFEIDLNIEISRAKRYHNDLSFIMFDIDHFKDVNDTYGHKTGDYILEKLASIIKSNIREDDLFARYGGEEFIIMLFNSNKQETINKADELRKLVEGYKFDVVGQVTISLGVYKFKDEDTYETITEKVDKAMYAAKKAGRNKVKYIE